MATVWRCGCADAVWSALCCFKFLACLPERFIPLQTFSHVTVWANTSVCFYRDFVGSTNRRRCITDAWFPGVLPHQNLQSTFWEDASESRLHLKSQLGMVWCLHPVLTSKKKEKKTRQSCMEIDFEKTFLFCAAVFQLDLALYVDGTFPTCQCVRISEIICPWN